jgi:hypothetical protein
MAYFPHAFHKMLVATASAPSTPFKIGAAAATTTLTAGQVAVVDAFTNQTINLTAAPVFGGGAGQFSQVYLAQGSFHTKDKLGPFHGGYQETVKSKGINPKYVSEFYVTAPAAAVKHAIQISQVNCDNITCDTVYDLRLDIKGSPALRFLTHNVYQTLSVTTGCCTQIATPGVNDKIDPNVLFLGWADQINGLLGGNNSLPFLNQFASAKVYNKTALSASATGTLNATQITVAIGVPAAPAIAAGNKIKFTVSGVEYTAYVASTYVSGATVPLVDVNGVAFALPVAVPAATPIKVYAEITSATYAVQTGAAAITVDSNIDIVAAYVDTQFGDCSFDPKDHFEKEPLLIYASLAAHANNSNDLGGNTCDVSCFNFGILSQGKQGKGFGETLVRELILAKRYQQEPWYQDPRMREVMDDTTLVEIPRTVAGQPASYFVYYLLHSVPRKANPSGTFDNDQYLVKIVTQSRTAATAVNFETWWNTFLASAGSPVQLKVVL